MALFRNFPNLRYPLLFCGGFLLLMELRGGTRLPADSLPLLMGIGGAGLSGRFARRRKASGAVKRAEAVPLPTGEVFQRIAETLPDLLYIYDLNEQRNLYVNHEVGAMLGYTAAEIQEMGPQLFVRLIHPEDLPYVAEQSKKIFQLPDGEILETEYRMQRKDGLWRWLLSRDSIFARDGDGRPTQTLGIAQDITERKKAQEAIQWQAALLRHTTDAATLGFYVADSATNAALYYNTRFLELWGLTPLTPRLQAGEVTHRELMTRCLPQIKSRDGEAVWEPESSVMGRASAEDVIRLQSGRSLRRSATDIHNDAGDCLGRFYLFEDITAQHLLEEQLETQIVHIQEANVQLEMQAQMLNQANAQLERLATTDGLTGLQNNRAFREFLNNTLAQAGRSGAAVSLILLDVDRFKQYNDSFGHPAGDEVLKQVGRILREMTREADCAARYGGEEFILVLPATGAEGAALLAERIRAALEALEWAHRPVTASFGVMTREAGRQDAAALIAEADRALYEAKHQGRNRVVHARELPPVSQENAAA